jgi:hypothetical protein
MKKIISNTALVALSFFLASHSEANSSKLSIEVVNAMPNKQVAYEFVKSRQSTDGKLKGMLKPNEFQAVKFWSGDEAAEGVYGEIIIKDPVDSSQIIWDGYAYFNFADNQSNYTILRADHHYQVNIVLVQATEQEGPFFKLKIQEAINP